METDDRKWIIGGGGCAAAGLVISLATGSWTWFAVGATTGAALVGARLYYKATEPEDKKEPAVVATAAAPGKARSLPYAADMLGAPPVDPRDTRPANSPRMLSRGEVVGYPMRHRVPECDAFALPMDPRGYSGLVDEVRRVW